jgi:hypothetical protein
MITLRVSPFVCIAAFLALLGAAPAPEVPLSGDDLFAAGNFDEAAAAYEKRLAATPNDPVANAGLATIELYRDDLTAAKVNAIRALSVDPGNARAMGVAAEIQRRTDDWSRKSTIDGDLAVVPFVVTDPLPIVSVRIGSHDAQFVLDTGAPGVVLDPAFAKDLGLGAPPPAPRGKGPHAARPSPPPAKMQLDSIAIGAATAYAVDVTIRPTRGMLVIPNVRIDGIIGTGLFERFLTTIDYPNARLILRPRTDAVSAKVQDGAQSSGATIVPFWLAGDHFVIARARVNDAPPGLFLFDSGLGGGVLPSPELVDAAHIKLDNAHAGVAVGGAGNMVAVPFVAHTIALGSTIEHDVPGIYTPEGSPITALPFTAEGVIAHDFLRKFSFTLDFTAMKLDFSAAANA